MWKTVALVVVVLVAGVLGFAATRPDDFSVQRSIVIAAPADAIYPRVADFHRWPEWSPWEKLDPAMQRTHSGAASGTGAAYSWQGNDKVGAGRMQITAATPPSSLAIQLDFLTPFEAHNTTLFSFAPEGDATRVTWVMRGPSPYLSKLIGVFVSMDRMVGGDFETGLANLKAASERR